MKLAKLPSTKNLIAYLEGDLARSEMEQLELQLEQMPMLKEKLEQYQFVIEEQSYVNRAYQNLNLYQDVRHLLALPPKLVQPNHLNWKVIFLIGGALCLGILLGGFGYLYL